jgi:hypothetical protein
MPLHIPKFMPIAKYRYDVIVCLFTAILLSATLSGCLEAEDEDKQAPKNGGHKSSSVMKCRLHL